MSIFTQFAFTRVLARLSLEQINPKPCPLTFNARNVSFFLCPLRSASLLLHKCQPSLVFQRISSRLASRRPNDCNHKRSSNLVRDAMKSHRDGANSAVEEENYDLTLSDMILRFQQNVMMDKEKQRNGKEKTSAEQRDK